MVKNYIPAELPVDEAFRLQSLHGLEVLDTPAESEFDALVKVAALVCGKPISLISLVDAERQWFKADVGLDAPQTPRDVAFCAHAILNDGIFEVQDTLLDERFARNPLVLAAPDIRFYAGAPITLSNGARVGTLCVIDRAPGALTTTQREVLQSLSIAAAKAMESRQALIAKHRYAQAESKAVQDLRALNERFLVATQSVGMGIWELDLDTNTVNWDDQNYRLYQQPRTADNEPYTVWRNNLHPDDVADAEAQMALAVKGEKSFDKSFRIIWPTGEVRHIQGYARDVRDASGTIKKLVGVNFDVTDVHHTREKLLSGKQLLEESQAIAKVGGWELDLQTGVLFWTDETYRIHETTPDKFNPSVDAGVDFFLPDSRDIISAALELAISTGQGYDLELQTHTTQGRLIDVRTTCKVTLQDGKATKLVGIFQDISERKAYERSLQEARLTAEQATRVKGQFLANMSHEIRTPMNAILGMLALLQKTELSPQQDDYVSKTKGAANSLLGLLNDILDISKVDAGKMALDLHAFRLDSMLRDLAVILSANVGHKPVEVLYDIDGALPEVLVGDPQRLQQVLLNLAGNAVKFTASGEVVVHIRMVELVSGVARIAFAVQDTGIGIAPENQAHIFSGFSQAEASTTRKFGGTGLGLAISQQLVGMMGGNILLTSVAGSGSTFAFEIVLPVVSEVPAELAVPKSLSATARRVLVVDDNPTALRITAKITRSWGWPTDTAPNGMQALEAVRARTGDGNFPYDVIFVDCQMQGMDGWETVHQIRTLHQTLGGPRPVLVMVSAHSRESLSDRTEQEQSQLDGFLVKPVTASMLQEAALGSDSAVSRLRQARRSGANTRKLTGMRILVVEDNLINQQVAEELLMSEGGLVSLAANGRLGLDAVAAAVPQFDVVLMDLQMPVMDGFAATRAIRTQLGLQSLPIVAMTANAMSSDRDACLAAGMTEHVGKPFDLPKLVNLLLRVTGRRGQETFEVATAASGEEFPVFDGIDLPGALTRMSGKKTLYLRSAKDFLRMLASTVADWRASVPLDRKAAHAQMHTLKGTAAIMGAVELSSAAARLEKLAQTDASDDDLLLRSSQLQMMTDATTRTLEAVILHLQGAIESGHDATGAGAAQPGQLPSSLPVLNESLDALIALLGASDLAALEKFAELRPVLEAVDPTLFEALEEALQSLDMAAALAICSGLRHPAGSMAA